MVCKRHDSNRVDHRFPSHTAVAVRLRATIERNPNERMASAEDRDLSIGLPNRALLTRI
jgi:hypothetical protein